MSDQLKVTVSIRRGAMLGLCAAAGVMFGLAVGTAGAQTSTGGDLEGDNCINICLDKSCGADQCSCRPNNTCKVISS